MLIPIAAQGIRLLWKGPSLLRMTAGSPDGATTETHHHGGPWACPHPFPPNAHHSPPGDLISYNVPFSHLNPAVISPECFLPCHTHLQCLSLSSPPPPLHSELPFIPIFSVHAPLLRCGTPTIPTPHLFLTVQLSWLTSGEAWSLWLFSFLLQQPQQFWAFRKLLSTLLFLHRWRCDLPKSLPSSTACFGSSWPTAKHI